MILLGDCIERMREMESDSVDAIVTDPPYGLSFMGKKWDYDVPSADIWREALRVLKPGGHLLSFGGTRTYHRMVEQIENAGFEIRDMLSWLYGSGFPKSLDISKAIDKAAGAEREVVGRKLKPNGEPYPEATGYGNLGFNGDTPATLREKGTGKTLTGRNVESEIARLERVNVTGKHAAITAPATPDAYRYKGWGTALKPSNEPICLARKPLSEKTVAANVLRWGVGGLNIDASRIEGKPRTTHADGNFQSKTKNTEVYGEFGLGYQCPEPTGRWPANTLFDESAAELLDEQTQDLHGAGAKRSGGKAKQDQSGGLFGVGEHEGNGMRFGDSGGASRFFYVAKSSKKDRSSNGVVNNIHPTCKPTKLMEYLIRLITPPGGTVLDPFAGSGSTGVAAYQLGFKFIGIEMSEEYCEIARRRMQAVE